jgi:calcineurin-like phosphoesterase family protein
MNRRDFVKWGGAGLAGVALGGPRLPWLGASARAADGVVTPWKFGVMADTQWKKNLDGQNPGTVAVGIVNLLNAEFIRHGVQLVIQVGDLVDVENDALNGNSSRRNMPVRAAAAQALYDAGIGFFPLRGNHEGSSLAAQEFVSLYPQTRGLGTTVLGASGFSSPDRPGLQGLSYAFDHGNVRFVLLDQFTRTDGSGSTDTDIVDQLPWIDRQLAARPADAHAFVFAHKNLIGQNHVDCLFGSNPAANPAAREAFIASLQARGVRYCIGGHDHMHHRSIVTSPSGAASVGQLICSSNSYKFYQPQGTSNDETYDHPALERPVAQELFTIGYYIFTVSGPRVTVDYYASTTGVDYGDVDLVATPTGVRFFKRETFGYSLNGKQFLVPQGGSLDQVEDAFEGTTARILAGVNGTEAVDASRRPLAKSLHTGWSHAGVDAAASRVLSLWGMADNLALWDGSLAGLLPNAPGSFRTDAYVLSMGYDPGRTIHLGNGGFGIATRSEAGAWVNAVDLNSAGEKRFVVGAYEPGFGLGMYGVDPSTRTAWAVLDHEGDFVVARDLDAVPGHR